MKGNQIKGRPIFDLKYDEIAVNGITYFDCSKLIKNQEILLRCIANGVLTLANTSLSNPRVGDSTATVTMVAGELINLHYRGATSYLELAVSPGGSGSTDIEAVQDIVGAMLQDSPDVDVTYDDAGNVENIALKTDAGSALFNKMNTDMSNADVGALKSIAIGHGKLVDFSLDKTKAADCGFTIASNSQVLSGNLTIYTPTSNPYYSAQMPVFKVGANALALRTDSPANVRPILLDENKEYGINFTCSDTITFPATWSTATAWSISIAQDTNNTRMLLGATLSITGSWKNGLAYSTDGRTFTSSTFTGTQPALSLSSPAMIYVWYNNTPQGEKWLCAQLNSSTGKTSFWVSSDGGVTFQDLYIGSNVNSFSNSTLAFWDPISDILFLTMSTKSLGATAMYKRTSGVWATTAKYAPSPLANITYSFSAQTIAYNTELSRYECMFQTYTNQMGFIFVFDPNYIYNLSAVNWTNTDKTLKICEVQFNTLTTELTGWHGPYVRYYNNIFFYSNLSTNVHSMITCPNDYFIGTAIAGTTYSGDGMIQLSAMSNVPCNFFVTNRTKNGTTSKMLISIYSGQMFSSFIFEPSINMSYLIDNRISLLKTSPFITMLPKIVSIGDSIQVRSLYNMSQSAGAIIFSYIAKNIKINGVAKTATYEPVLTHRACTALLSSNSAGGSNVVFTGITATPGSTDSQFSSNLWVANNYN